MPCVPYFCVLDFTRNEEDELAEIAKHNKVSVRFIELMPMGEGRSISIYKAQKLLRDWKKNTENLKKQVTEVMVLVFIIKIIALKVL